MAQVQIISTGTPRTSRVLVDGEMLRGVQRVELIIDVGSGRTDAWIKVLNVGADVELASEQVAIQQGRPHAS